MKAGPRIAIVLSVVLVLSMVAPPVLAQGETTSVPESETFTTNGVEVWQESIFTLRHDFADASSSVETGQYIVRIGEEGEQPLDRGSVGVRTAGESVTLGYNADKKSMTSDAVLTNSEVQLVAARVTGSGEPVTTFAEAVDLISQDNANSNATFEMVNEGKALSGNQTEYTHKKPSAGHYVYFAVETSSGEFTVSNGQISVERNPTIVGVEQISFERGSPTSVSAPTVAEPGDRINFDIDTSDQFSQNDVTHAVVVYDQSKFSSRNDGGRFRLVVDDRSDINSNFNLSEDSTLEHDITRVNGFADVEPGITVNGIDIANGEVSRAINLGTVVDFVAEDINGNPPDTDETGREIRFDASTTAVASTTPQAELTVDTFGNWTTGTYQYVYIGSLESNASAVTTDTGTISIQEDIDQKITVNREEVVEVQSESVSSGSASVETTQGAIRKVDFSGVEDGTSVTVAPLQGRPSKITEESEPEGVSSYVELNATPAQDGGTATVSITVPQSQFNDPTNAQVYRYDDTAGQFEELNIVDRTQSESDVTIEFETQFSTFAIGEGADTGGDDDGGDDEPASTGGGGGGGGVSSASFSVSELTPQSAEVTQGETITVTATIATESYLDNTQDVELRIGGETIATQSVSLQNQESVTVEFTNIDTGELAGEYEHGVFTSDDSATGSLTVNVPAGADEEATEDESQAEETETTQEDEPANGATEDRTPGFGPIVALLAIVLAGLLATRRTE